MVDMFNIDLPRPEELRQQFDSIESAVVKVAVRMHNINGVMKKHGKIMELGIPLWDHALIEENLFVFLYPAFKWLSLFTHEQIHELVVA